MTLHCYFIRNSITFRPFSCTQESEDIFPSFFAFSFASRAFLDSLVLHTRMMNLMTFFAFSFANRAFLDPLSCTQESDNLFCFFAFSFATRVFLILLSCTQNLMTFLSFFF